MSLWTPDGEVPVERSGAEERPATSASEMLGGPNLDDLSPEERAQAEEMIARMAEVQRQLLSHPASVFVANHLMGLYELAAVHLDQPEPKYDEVRLAIDHHSHVRDAIVIGQFQGPDEVKACARPRGRTYTWQRADMKWRVV